MRTTRSGTSASAPKKLPTPKACKRARSSLDNKGKQKKAQKETESDGNETDSKVKEKDTGKGKRKKAAKKGAR
jgi:hypothetical protein